jgi:intracellular septation protein A
MMRPSVSATHADAEPAAPAPPGPPHLRDVLLRVVISVATALLVPSGLLWTVLRIFNFPTAVVAALAWMVAAMGLRWATGRPVSGLLVLALGALTVRTALTLATGSAFVYFIQPVFADATIAIVFLGSLWSARPAIARIAPDFYPMDATIAARPRMRTLFRRLTLMWGLVILVEAGITLVLLVSVSTSDFVLMRSGAITALTGVAVVVTVAWSVLVGRREGLLRVRP